MQGGSFIMENNTPAKKSLPAFLILGIIALVAALVLALTNAVTKGPIQEIAMAALRESFGTVMPADAYEEIPVGEEYGVRSLYAAKNGDEVIGWCVTAAGKGYGGDVAVTLGVGPDGLVTGCAVGDTSFAETPGFGTRAKDASFQDQFVGMDAVNGGSFEALSGATVTSNAVLDAVNKALHCVTKVALEKEPAVSPLVAFGAPAEKPAAPSAPMTGDVRKGTAGGFQSDVTVEVSLDETGAVTALNIDSSNETPGFGTRCAEDAAFMDQFVGKTGPFAIGEGIDALSGATVTSEAVVKAINAALAAPASAPAAFTGTAGGFQSDVTVTITVENGAIASMVIDSANETPGFGTRCAEDAAFIQQFIGKSGTVAIGDGVDALSGATVTSEAVVKAVNAALKEAAAAPGEEVLTPIASSDAAEVATKENGAAVVTPAEGSTGEVSLVLTVKDGKVTGAEFVAAPAEETPAASDNGEITGTAQGYQSEVKVTVTLNADNTIATISVDSSNETEYFGTRCGEDEDFQNQFIGKAAPFVAGENVDVLTRATITSNAVIEALNNALTAPAEETPAASDNGEITGTAQGYQSEVKVTVTLNADNTIATISVDSSNETEYFGTRCGEDEAFQNQFIGKAAPFVAGENVDVLTRATITSNAVIEALNNMLAAPAEETPAASDNGEITGTAQGYQSEVKVTVTLNADNTIATISIDSSNETEYFGTRCGEDEAFQNQFIGKSAPFVAGENVDVLSRATITSNAVIEALNNMLAAPAEEAPAASDNGEITGTAQGYQSEVKVTVTLNADNTIATISIDSSNETEYFGTRCGEDEDFQNQFIGKAAPFVAGENVDVLTRATITSTAVIEALNNMLAAPAEETPAASDNGEITGTAQGYQSEVKVTVTLNADNTIATISIDSSNETEYFGTRCGEDEDFQNQFIGKAAPFVAGENVDVLSRATITSNAVIEALNNMLQ